MLDHRRGAEMKVHSYNTTEINKRKIGKYILIEITVKLFKLQKGVI